MVEIPQERSPVILNEAVQSNVKKLSGQKNFLAAIVGQAVRDPHRTAAQVGIQ
jgi:hypothetical protein